MNQVPDWFGTAALAALLAGLGYLAKLAIEGYAGVLRRRRERRAKLVELASLLRAGRMTFGIQARNRDRLNDLIEARAPQLVQENRGLGYDALFAAAYPDMKDAELRLHSIVRGLTVHAIRPLNDGLLAWLQADTYCKARRGGDGPWAQLAVELGNLEAHLYQWRAKYEAWIPHGPERSLVYLADEHEHGIGFPGELEPLVEQLLARSPSAGT